MPTRRPVIPGDQNQPLLQSPVVYNEGRDKWATKGDSHSPTFRFNARAVLKDKQQPVELDSALKQGLVEARASVLEYPNDGDKKEAAAEAMLELQREMVADEVSKVFNIKQGFYTGLYLDLVEDEEIDAFLQTSPLYNWKAKRWTGILHPLSDSPPFTKSELTDRLYTIISTVMEKFGNCGTSRQLKTTHHTKLFHEMADSESAAESSSHYSSPSFVIVAEGSSFELPPKNQPVNPRDGECEPQLIGFTNITTCIDVTRYAELSDDNSSEENEMHAVYAQQIFVQQPNRRFVRTISIDEMGVDFFHIDRSGLHRGSMNSYHSRGGARSFIRMVIGLSSLDEEILGLDTSIRWKVDAAGRKTRGTLTVKDDETKKTTRYNLTSVQPVFKQYCIGNRGTVCWSVRDRTKKQNMIVKDSWRTNGATPEHESLKKARGLEGVAQIVSYEADQAQTKDFVTMMHLPDDPTGGAGNLIQSRVVMEQYGRHLGYFESEKQLLCALRDAIAAHRGLYTKGDTLHRDMARSNILFGKPGALPGNQGILIDLDLAERISKVAGKAAVVGHLQYLSISMLLNVAASGDDDTLAHDYLDDMESSFYVTAALTYEYNGPKKLQDPSPEILNKWLEFQDATTCRENLEFKKRLMLSERPADPTQHMAPYWSDATRVLLQRFYNFTREMAQEKVEIRECQNDTWRARLDKLYSKSDVFRNYDTVLGFFDEAISKISKSENKKTRGPTVGKKRVAEEDPVEDLNEAKEKPRQLRTRRQRT
ncbi:hypothetical protein EST38_g9323 [Candolleomyces aberdarensis]|uniref:Fungal-type protein kinase domain-containing protein n=1 Tax=Candolleomyces aberdarensis TaxID=2316362 RepID=A0A4Q2DA96_9AGAR|nr:hypothetical protein EST38_g9323 [Candolleomyces aberdarensis]